MKRGLSYFVILIGIIVLSLSILPVKKYFITMLPELSSIPNYVIIVLGSVILVIGIFLFRKSSYIGQRLEVPIYQGRNIVGYRRA